MRTVFIREMLKAGVLVTASHNVTYAMNSTDIARIFTAYDTALAHLAKELGQGGLDARLGDDIIKPIFAVRSTN